VRDERRLVRLSIAALGVVYGDIGTSPLYAVRECFHGHYGIAASAPNVLGVMSLILWALIVVISIKYLVFVLRADNRGEGGILALLALLSGGGERRHAAAVVAVGLFGAALLYGDGMITPAISVLSAIEGLRIETALFAPYVRPITIAILVLLFAAQHRGTDRVGAAFGPVSLLWFVLLAALGVRAIVADPAVLAAVDPLHALAFVVENRGHALFVLGAVFLVVTGGEALYADMGHFGRRPIRLTWFGLVLPALLLNYFGQGALLLADPAAASSPFYLLAPAWALLPLVLVATCATIIASQAVISGCFSLTRQAVQLGYAPRLRIEHTSSETIGQIYVPHVNWALMVATIALVVGFRSSSNLAAAYGVAVSTTMVITTVLLGLAARDVWHWRWWVAAILAGAFLIVDLAFLGANVLKIPHGGWFPLVVAGVLFTAMSTWQRGRQLVARNLRDRAFPLGQLLADLRAHPPTRVPGTAVFMTSAPQGVPVSLLHNLKHNKVLHERVLLLTVQTAEVPEVPRSERAQLAAVGDGFYRVIFHYGFLEDPNVPYDLERVAKDADVEFRLMETTFFLGRETLLPRAEVGLALWRARLFALMVRNAESATTYFHLPPNRVIEIGVQLEI
jgi:KUP system potassium uptake protein